VLSAGAEAELAVGDGEELLPSVTPDGKEEIEEEEVGELAEEEEAAMAEARAEEAAGANVVTSSE
jgi:hypothetical protein